MSSHLCIWVAGACECAINYYYSFFICRVRLGNGILRTERGEYELRDGKRVFKIRGYFQYITPTVMSMCYAKFIHLLMPNTLVTSNRVTWNRHCCHTHSMTPASIGCPITNRSLLITYSAKKKKIKTKISIQNCWRYWSDERYTVQTMAWK